MANTADVWCWQYASEEDRAYHFAEWGVPVHDDTQMFEHLCLEGLQCGLSWNYVLLRRDLYRQCFHGFDIDAVAAMGDAEVEALLEVPGVLRNRAKLHAIVNNARAAQRVRAEFGTFCDYFWGWSGGKTILYMGHQKGGIPASNGLSTRMAADLKKRGFKYVGPVNIYAHLQSCGIVCDHNEACPRYAYVCENYPTVRKRRDNEK
jgi:DNA-3-methyladenine glycosylase I